MATNSDTALAPETSASVPQPTTSPQPTATASASGLPTDYKLYKPPQSGSSSAAVAKDIPDSFYEPSSADLKEAQSMLHARTEALKNRPLQTQEMREREEKKKESRWPTTTIRVKFADGTQLEKVFPSTDKIRSIYAFVRSSLREDVKPVKFVLYQLPNRELRVSDLAVRDLTLSRLELAPRAVLQLRFVDEALNHPTVSAPLAPEVLTTAVDLPSPPDYDKKDGPSSSSSSRPKTGGSSLSTGDKKIPKWLKIGITFDLYMYRWML
ncbi:hypothetical protein PENSPDRAFT_238447 [Peniophora sp. CONT]|nr:hypothetical protein PENSPDRAFT_238447 [Peniophora sp. CONT]